jgi:hypothetical protein
MIDRQPVQFIPELLPSRQILTHKGMKTVVMVSLQKMSQFMDQNIFQTRKRLFRKLKIQPDSLLRDIAGTPFRFHLLDTPEGNLDIHLFCPMFDQLCNALFQLSAVPFLDDVAPVFKPPPASGLTCRSKYVLLCKST